MGAQLVGDGQTLGSLLVAEARRGELALAGRGAQGGQGCGAGHVALERAVAKLAPAAALKILFTANSSQTVYNTKGTRAHTHRELIRTWLWEPKGSSLEYI